MSFSTGGPFSGSMSVLFQGELDWRRQDFGSWTKAFLFFKKCQRQPTQIYDPPKNSHRPSGLMHLGYRKNRSWSHRICCFVNRLFHQNGVLILARLTRTVEAYLKMFADLANARSFQTFYESLFMDKLLAFGMLWGLYRLLAWSLPKNS